jgi:serine/threonine-protein kinase
VTEHDPTDATTRLRAALADRYRIEREIGAGGMATVYVAHDVRHDRRVAVKVLRPELAAVIGAARFLTEIKTTANLQHPHILGLIDSGSVDGTVYYVMPFVEGESLRDRLSREKQLPVADAVRITTEVASALDYAHRHGVIHRDIKPENILLHDNQALVADFGIALAVSRVEGSSRMTETGMSLGTPQYMSPEQAMGERNLDARTDVYALGCVLYEMLSGDPPFTGSSAQAVVAKVLTAEPDSLATTRRTAPRNVVAAAMTALSKLPADRFATAAEFADALRNTQFATAVRTGEVALGVVAPPSRPSLANRPFVVAASIAVVASVVAIAAMLKSPAAAPERVVRFELALPDSPRVSATMYPRRDGNTLVTSSVAGVFERRLDGTAIRRLGDAPDGASDYLLALSLDGSEGLFWGDNDDRLWIAPLAGGPARLVANEARGATWGSDDFIYYATEASVHAIVRAPARGGRDDTLAVLSDSTDNVVGLAVSPNARALVASLRTSDGDARLAALDLRSKRWAPLGPGGGAVGFVPPWYLVFSNDQFIMAAPFDEGRSAFSAPALPVAQVAGGGDFTVGGGVLTYPIGRQQFSGGRLAMVTRTGQVRALPNVPDSMSWSSVTVTRDGKRLAVIGNPAGGRGAGSGRGRAAGAPPPTPDIFVYEFPSGPMTRLSSSFVERHPTWSPDGKDLAYVRDSSTKPLIHSIVRQQWDVAGAVRTIISRPDSVAVLRHLSWLPTGRGMVLRYAKRLASDSAGGLNYDIGLLSFDTPDSIRPLVTSRFSEQSFSVSPDGTLLAYDVREGDGTRVPTHVYVQPLAGGQRRQVSLVRGTRPAWSWSSKDLFFMIGDTLSSAPITVGSDGSITVGGIKPWFRMAASDYAPLPGDSLFVAIVFQDSPGQLGSGGTPAQQQRVMVVVNFVEELRRMFAGKQ